MREIRRLPELLERLRVFEAPLFSREGRYAVVGCGSSYHIGLVLGEIAALHGYNVQAYTSGSVLVREEVRRLVASADAVALISRTGTTTETVRVAELLQGATRTVGICCADSSPLTAITDEAFNFGFMAEESVVMTSSFSAILAFLLSSLGELRKEVEELLNATDAVRREMARLEESVSRVHFAKKSHFVFLGYGPNLYLAKEAALKVQELSLSRTEFNEPLEYRHGPISTLSESTHATLFGPIGELERELADELRARGASVEVLEPSNGDALLGTIVFPAYAQFLGYEKAVSCGLDPDRPRGLVKSVQLSI